MRLCYGPSRTLLLAGVLLCGAATSPAQTQTTPSSSTPGQAISGTQGVSPFAGSVPAKAVPGVMPISLREAIDRGLKQNLGLLLSNADIRAARGQRWQQLSALLPHVTAAPYADVSQINLNELGISLRIPGINFPPSVRFSYYDARVSVDQSLFDWKSINATRAASQSLKSAEYTYKDARDLVVLAVGYTYLQAIADEARIQTAEAQVRTGQALFDQATDRVNAGTSPAIDALRAKVELQTRQQQLIQAKNNFAIQKLTVARVIGLAPGQEFELTDKSPYQPFEGISVEEALKRAYATRSDYQAAMTDVRAAEFSRKAAVAGYYPSLSFSGDYGAGGKHLSTGLQVYDARGTLTIPIFQGGSVHGEVLQADARLEQSRERLDNLRAQIDSDVRTALLNLQSSADQVNVARSNIDLAEETLVQSRDRFIAGVTDTVEVVQSQEAVASAHEQYISSLYSYNFAKISLARALGVAEEAVKEYFKGK
ncbi:MAG: outer rane efflux protein [Candidatus Acidoferrum typicum]|nr:outer rane efflux protein [Candidatus Acidoferrum typicum]